MDGWEFKKCGRTPGGFIEKQLGICPAWPDNGQCCARVAGTFCKGEIQGTFAKKLSNYMQCNFYKLPRHLRGKLPVVNQKV